MNDIFLTEIYHKLRRERGSPKELEKIRDFSEIYINNYVRYLKQKMALAEFSYRSDPLSAEQREDLWQSICDLRKETAGILDFVDKLPYKMVYNFIIDYYYFRHYCRPCDSAAYDPTGFYLNHNQCIPY